MADRFGELSTVAFSEDISLYLPSSSQQEVRIPLIRKIRRAIEDSTIRRSLETEELPLLKQEINRLQMNVMEMQDMAFLGGQDKVDNKCKDIVGDPDHPGQGGNIIAGLLDTIKEDESRTAAQFSAFQKSFSPYFKESVVQMSSPDNIFLENLPDSILDRYSNKQRSEFLITVFPVGNCWQDAEFLKNFVHELEQVSDKSTGMPPVFRALIEIIGKDGRNAALLTLLIVFVLLWIDFKRPHYALMAMVPLAFGALWMVGFMKLAGMQFTVMNVMALPLIIGIGIDDGVHIVHRWMNEGRGRIKIVFSSTGKAILLTSLTTMIAFGSLVFSIWRGFGQLGGALFLGVAACFLTTVVVLSGILGVIERKQKK
jgi:predicted RND superfamily exporter protein